jgi:hypothetical protein
MATRPEACSDRPLPPLPQLPPALRLPCPQGLPTPPSSKPGTPSPSPHLSIPSSISSFFFSISTINNYLFNLDFKNLIISKWRNLVTLVFSEVVEIYLYIFILINKYNVG